MAASATAVTKNCADYDLKYASGQIERTCTAGAWGAIVLDGASDCVIKTCTGVPAGETMAAGFDATNAGAVAEKQCSAVNAQYKVNTAQKVTATCEVDATTGVAAFTGYDTTACEWAACAAE